MSFSSADPHPSGVPTVPRLHTVDLVGPAGRLESVLNEGAPDAPFAALVCHPHPQGGGTLHNKVVYHTMKVLNAPEFGLNWPVLRFNFRGTGRSEGQHDGRAETEDVSAAIDWLVNAYKRPLIVAGFSFGAAMALRACCGRKDSAVKAFIALGLPTHAQARTYQYGFLSLCSFPKLFLSGDRDQYAPADELLRVADQAADPKDTVLIPGADHFFTGHLPSMQDALINWLRRQVQ